MSLKPKKKNNKVTMRSVQNLGTSEKMNFPPIALKIVISVRAPTAPIKTASLLNLVAKIIARKKVLSPISETNIAIKAVVKEASILDYGCDL